MLTDTAFLDDAQVLGGVACEPPSTEPCWVNMSTLSSGASGSSSSSSSSNSTNSSSSSSGNNSSAVIKKRRKSDTKPLSQLNKCLNEKRRREQENVYIEELAELISASIADMNSLSVKPDKCAILQETVNQIRRIKEQEEEDRNARGDDVVQQGEVSSSKPALLDTQVLGTFLLEALDGFLFVVNTEGKIEYVSENVTHFLQYNADDLVSKSIYNIIHLGDHARFSSSLLPTSIGWPGEVSTQARSRCFNCRLLVKPPDDQEETMEEKQQRVSQYENMQISAVPQPYPGEKSEGAEGHGAGDSQHCLVCVARRIPAAEKQQGPTVEQFTTKLDLSGKILAVDTNGVSPAYNQYLNKDLVGCVIRELCHPDDLNKLTLHLKEALQNSSSTSPIYRLRVAPSGDREKAAPVVNIFVQTKSKKFPYNPLTQEAEFVMATHSVIGDNELALLDCDLGSGLVKSAPGVPVGGPSNGNPVLTSVVRSDVIAPAAATPLAGLSDNAGFGLSNSFNSFPLTSTDYEFNLDLFPTSTWGPIPTDVDDPLNPTIAGDAVNSHSAAAPASAALSDPLLGAPAAAAAAGGGSLGNWGSPPARPASTSGGQNPLSAAVTNLGLLSSRPSSRQSAASTPRPPSVSAFSPAPNSMLGIHSVVSPLTGNPGSVGMGPQLQPSPASMNLPYSSNFPFSPLQESAHLGGHTPTTNPGTPLFEEPRDTKDGILHLGVSGNSGGGAGDSGKDANSMLNSLLNSDPSSVESSGRLRVLLMQRSAVSQANGGGGSSSTSGQNSLLSLSLSEDADNRTSALQIKRERIVMEKSVQNNRILKNLLDQDEDEDAATSVERLLASSSSAAAGRSHNLQFAENIKASPSSAAAASSSGNEMLHTLLNQRSDDDDLENRHGLRKQNELLKQLLKDADEEDQAQHKRGEQLLKSLGFTSPPTSLSLNTPVSKSPALASSLESMLDFGSGGPGLRGTKRPSDEAREDVKPSKQPSLSLGTKSTSAVDQGPSSNTGGAVGGGGGGVLQQLLGPVANNASSSSVGAGPGPPGGPSLCERNKMLASLLAKTPLQPTLPVSTASPKPSALPQEKLPRDLKEKIMQNPGNPSSSAGNHWTGGNIQPALQQQQPVQQQQPLQQQQQQQNAFPVQQNIMQQRLQQQQQPGPVLQQQHQVARSQNMQQQQQQQQLLPPHPQQQQQQPQQLAPQSSSFLNTLLARSVETTGPGLRNTAASDQQQQHFVQQPQQQQQQVQLNTNASMNPVQLRPIPTGMLSQNQVGLVSAALSSGGGFSISLNDSTLAAGHSSRTLMSSTGPTAQQQLTPLDNLGPLGSVQNRAFSSIDADFPADWGIQGSDSLLSDILDQAIEMNSHYEPVGSSSVSDDFVAAFVEQLISSSTVIDSAALAPPPVTDINEKLAISAIQESLMSFETSPPALPAYNASYANAPPSAAVTITQQNSNQVGMNTPPAPNNNSNSALLASQQMVVQRRQKLLLQQQQRRLVGRQGQAMNDNSVAPQGGVLTSTFQQMDDLLNGVPPNMTITRSGTIPDSQSSPGYGARLLSSPLNSTGHTAQISPGLRNPSMQPPFSPHGQVSSSFGTATVSAAFASGSQSRLSPLGNLPTYSGAQVSPRVQHQQQLAHFSSAQLSPQSGSMGLGARASPGMNQPSTVVNWSTTGRSHPAPLPQQQQQSGPPPPPPPQQQQQLVSPINNYPPGSRGYAGMIRPSMRSLPSPGPQNPNVASARLGSFNTLPDGPNIGVNAAPQGGGGIFLQQQHPQMRLQRSISTSSTLTGPVLEDGSNLSSRLGAGRRFLAGGSPPSALIHHPASRYPGGPSCLAGRAVGAQPSYAGPAHLYSARVVALEQPVSRLPAGPAAHELSPFTAATPVHHQHHLPASLDDPPYFPFDFLTAHTTGNPVPTSTELRQTAGPGSVTNNSSAAPAMTSEFVRKELRAVVGARTNHSGGMTLSSAGILMNQPGHSLVGNSSSSSQPLMPGGQSLNQADLESLGLSLELPTGGADSGKSLWDPPSLVEPPNQRQNMNKSGGEDASRSSDPKMSLLQKLLSE